MLNQRMHSAKKEIVRAAAKRFDSSRRGRISLLRVMFNHQISNQGDSNVQTKLRISKNYIGRNRSAMTDGWF
jgi:hypothetical protein